MSWACMDERACKSTCCERGHPDKATHLGALVQGVATEQGEGLDVLGRRETGRHHPLLTPLGQLFAVLQHVAGDL